LKPIAKGPHPTTALALLLAINLFNYLDRQILSAVLPKVEAEFGRSKAEGGLAASMFLISYTFISPLFGWLGDRMSRWLLVGIGVIVWSLASGGTGLATSFGVLLLTRALIGVGEGAYGPVAPTLISDLYPVAKRGRKLAWFYVAIPVGSALGYVLGGAMAGSLGWRWAFYLVVPPGILLGMLSFFMREPPRGHADQITHRTARLRDYFGLLKIPSYVLCSLGMTAMTFAIGGIAVWIPTYYYEREGVYRISATTIDLLRKHPDSPPDPIYDALAPILSWFGVDPRPVQISEKQLTQLESVHGEFHGMIAFREELAKVLSPPEIIRLRSRIAEAARVEESSLSLASINTNFGLIVVVGGILATMGGGWLGDQLRPRFPGSYFLVSGVAMLLGFPAFLAAILAPLPWVWPLVFIGVFFLFFNTGPSNTILANVTHPSVRSSAFALNIMIIHLFGDVASPPIVGWVGDHYGLKQGMFLLSGAFVLAGVLWLWGAKYLERDTHRVAGSQSLT
jgi:MFS family permease